MTRGLQMRFHSRQPSQQPARQNTAGRPGKMMSWVTGETVSVSHKLSRPANPAVDLSLVQGQRPPGLPPGQPAAQIFQRRAQPQRQGAEQTKDDGHCGTSISE